MSNKLKSCGLLAAAISGLLIAACNTKSPVVEKQASPDPAPVAVTPEPTPVRAVVPVTPPVAPPVMAVSTPIATPIAAPVPAAKPTTLKDAYAGKFLIGTCYDPGNYSDAELANIKANYNVITPENSMKPGPIHPAENTYNFRQPDALVKFCEDNNIAVIGHNLCWHQQTANWFFVDANNAPVTKDVLIARFKSHITTVVGRYKGRIKGWDVVNEAINDGGNVQTGKTENLRSSNWLKIIGPEFLTIAFKTAHEADPKAELNYNDYNIESGPKHASSMVLLKRLIADGAPITGVGIQGHWGSNPNYKDIEQAIVDYKSLGLKVMITELDIATTGNNSGAFPGGGGGGGGGAAQGGAGQNTGSQRQATAYSNLMNIFLKHSDAVTRVTFWGIDDRRSWRASQTPLLFDAQLQPKPAFQAVLDAAINAGKFK